MAKKSDSSKAAKSVGAEMPVLAVHYVNRDGGPERLVCEAEIDFPASCGPLAGLKLTGFALWRGADGELHVTLPSRVYGAGDERKFFDYVRAQEGAGVAALRGLKQFIIDGYRARHEEPQGGAC